MAGGVEQVERLLVAQLQRSWIPAAVYVEEYLKIISFTLKKYDRVVDVESVDDTIFNCIQEFKEPSRSKAMWVFSLIDDYNNDRNSERMRLPIQCCNRVMEIRQKSPNVRPLYHCVNCKNGVLGRSEDLWIDKHNYPQTNR
ncbi:hypothetical protein [Photobacterium leiognathi]|uniref:hypothetical protein n=1 Tax=Photobacterium leiognathi TaxID=553611 RepID=UPI00298171F3|nr:hypothetical protein [Photobacterium leiognathi]